MVDLKYLRKVGVSSGAYKKIWTQDATKYSPGQKRLNELLAARLRDGRENCLSEWKAYKAIDISCDTPFSATIPTLLNHLISKNLDAKGTLEALKEWGLSESELFMDVQGENGQVGKALNIPLWYQAVIPLTKAYLAIRTAKMFNDRNGSPLLTYEPIHETARNRIYCDIITDIVHSISNNYGYSGILRQSIQQMNKYGLVIAFPREEWHCEKQTVEENGLEKEITVKEGLRYVLPDPTQMFADLKHPWTSLNTGTGCEFGGHFSLLSFGDVYDNRLYWNRERIYGGSNWHTTPNAQTYLREYFPCNMKFPDVIDKGVTSREQRATYASADRDKAVFMGNMFMNLCPNDWDLIDRKTYKKGYKHKLWHRFTMAGDDTVVWSEPCAYNPMWFMGYDYDMQAGRTSSLCLETLPWETQLTNFLSQMYLTAKQNLANCIFYDNRMVDVEDIKRLQNSGEARYRSTNYVGYDSFKYGRQGLNPSQAFTPVQLGKQNLAELFQLIPLTLNIMERVLQISAQETGTTAAHYQSAKEIGLTASNTSQRLQYTGSYVDDGIAAWKRQLVDAALAYKDVDFVAQVSADIPDVERHLAEMGFTITDRNDNHITVKGKRSSIKLEQFADTEREPDKERAKEVAQVLFQTAGVIAGQPELVGEIGAKTLLKIIERASIMAGAPRDFRLESTGTKGEGMSPQMMQALQQLQQTIMQTVNDKVAQPAAQAAAQSQQEMQQVQGEMSQMQTAIKQLEGIFKMVQSATDKVHILEKETAARIQNQQTEVAAKLQMEQQAAQAEQQRLNSEHVAEQQRRDAEVQADLERQKAASDAKIENDKKLAGAKAEAAKIAAKNKPKPAAKASSK